MRNLKITSRQNLNQKTAITIRNMLTLPLPTKIQWRCVKMKNEIQLRKCPKCGMLFSERGAVSRVHNVTIICSDCGTREALESIGVDEKEQEKILDTIHNTVYAN